MATEVHQLQSIEQSRVEYAPIETVEPTQRSFTFTENLRFYAPVTAALGAVALAAEQISTGEMYEVRTIAASAGLTALVAGFTKIIDP